MTKKICISGYYGFENFGDEIILKILVQNLKKFECTPSITVFSSNPKKTSSNLEINSVYSFNYLEIIKSIFNCNCLISGGGSLLQDITSIKSLIYYLGVICLAVIFRKKIIIFAQGIGPLNNKILKKLTAFLLKKAALVTVRDNNSLQLLNKWGIKAVKCCDPVWNLDIKKSYKTGKIGIQLRNFSDINELFINKFAYCINRFYKDKEIILLSLQNNIDLKICNKLKNCLTIINPELKITIIENTSNEKVIKDIVSLDELIAMRFHACLAAIKAEVKLLPVNYDIKVKSLADEFDLKYINIENTEEMEKIFQEFFNKNIVYNTQKINNLKFDFKILEQAI